MSKNQVKLSINRFNQYYFKSVKTNQYSIKDQILKNIVNHFTYERLLKYSISLILSGLFLFVMISFLGYNQPPQGYITASGISISIGFFLFPLIDVDEKQKLFQKIIIYPIIFLVVLLGLLGYLINLFNLTELSFFQHIKGIICIFICFKMFIEIVLLIIRVINKFFTFINKSEKNIMKAITTLSSIIAFITSIFALLPMIKTLSNVLNK